MTSSAVRTQSHAEIVATLVQYIITQHPSRYTAESLPRDQSMLELEVLDSAGVIELIVYVEATWNIEISDEDITKERMGSLNKLADLVLNYADRKN